MAKMLSKKEMLDLVYDNEYYDKQVVMITSNGYIDYHKYERIATHNEWRVYANNKQAFMTRF